MSDGPYKTLSMSKPWKLLAKVAANAVHSSAEVGEVMRPALLDDWSAVRPGFCDEVRAALGDNERGHLFPTVVLTEIQRLRSAASNPMEALLTEQACDAIREGQAGRQAFEAAVKSSLDERAIQRARQIEEHYLRERSPDAGRLRAQLRDSIIAAGTDQLATGIAAGASMRSLAPKTDRSGVEVGVPL